jgi:hypothetical protein
MNHLVEGPPILQRVQSQFGIKTFELCESSSGYLYSFIVYIGKETVLESLLILKDTLRTAGIVLKVSELLLCKGYTLWLSNSYTSPYLVRFLKSCNTDCVETMKINRKNVHKKVEERKKL